MVQVVDPLNSAINRTRQSKAVCCGTLQGKSASQGKAEGTARIVKTSADAASLRTGDVLIIPHASPAWALLLHGVAAVVLERGGILSSFAIIARERQIPAVVSVENATGLVPDGSLIEVDAAAGTIRWRTVGHRHG